MEWRKSSFCSTDHVTEQCVEIAETTEGRVLVRDTTGRVVGFTSDEFAAFLAGAKAGEFDDLT